MREDMDVYRLERFFESRVGRDWNSIYSELAELKRNRKSHGKNHCYGFGLYPKIATSTWRGKSGKIYADMDFGVEEIGGKYWRISQFYVEPETGILRKANRPKDRPKLKPLEVIAIDKDREYRKIDGIWYFIEYGQGSYPVFYGLNSLQQPLYKDSESKLRVILRKRQLNTRELKQLGISNAAR